MTLAESHLLSVACLGNRVTTLEPSVSGKYDPLLVARIWKRSVNQIRGKEQCISLYSLEEAARLTGITCANIGGIALIIWANEVSRAVFRIFCRAHLQIIYARPGTVRV